MKQVVCLAVALTLLSCTAPEARVVNLAQGVKVLLADGTPLEVGEDGHAAPVYHDFDGDGVPDLVVGEYQDGACRIYRNHGTETRPEFRDFEFLQAGGRKASVPPD